MPIPKSRAELVDQVTTTYRRLVDEIERAGEGVCDLPCVDEWSVKDLLAVRTWWTEHVVAWIEAGREGGELDLPAPGYSWQETPRLNADTVAAEEETSCTDMLARLEAGHTAVLETIASLDDHEILEPGVFEWAGKWPIARWISINTVRQYTTARTLIRRAISADRAKES